MYSSTMPSETNILVVGGGPVGMFTAFRLAKLGQSCVVVEKNTYTTIHPKIEYSNHRSMEIYRRIGLIDHLKPHAVPETYEFAQTYITGLGENNFADPIARIEIPSPAVMHEMWAKSNDGSHPLEPHMRQSQVIYEAELKKIIEKGPLVHAYWGYSFQSLIESDEGVVSTIADASGNSFAIKSKYVIACDGAGSRVRLNVGLLSPRRSLPMTVSYAHFKTKELSKMQSKGDFWHLMILTGALVVAQDEIDTYTISRINLPGVEYTMEDSLAFIKECLGGVGGPLDIDIDEVIVDENWKADISIADSFRMTKGRVFLAGDSAHQLTPAGGLGLNSGIHDAYDLTWKLTAVLLAELNTQIVEKAMMEFAVPLFGKAMQLGFESINASTEHGKKYRDEIRDLILTGTWVHSQIRTAMGYRYNGSPIVIKDSSTEEPPTSITEFIPSTWPGARAPHVFLSDGKTSIFDLYGPYFSIVDFTKAGKLSEEFVAVAKELSIPLTRIYLPNEAHCKAIWEREVVLVRLDGFVSWRCSPEGAKTVDVAEVRKVLLIATGKSA